MRKIWGNSSLMVRGSILALFLLGFAAAPQLAKAETATGTYQFSFDDGYTKYLDFQATKLNDNTDGQMFLSDEAPLFYYDLDGTGEKEEQFNGFFIKADLDDLVVNQNQAVMSGIVRDSSVPQLIGLRVLLTVEDNGDGGTRDFLTWGVYKPIQRDWIPSDAEWKEDPGVGLRWWAKDAERRDDVGYEMPRDESITTKSFPIASYAFADIEKGAGEIVVRP